MPVVLLVHGTADDYTTIGPCRDYAQRIAAAGTPVAFVAIDGAGHKFDGGGTQRLTLRGAQRLTDDCPIELDIDTPVAVERSTGQPLQRERLQAALRDCAATGASIEGNAAARDQAANATPAFLAKVFGR